MLRNRTSRFRFCATAARENCSRTNLILRRRKRRNPIRFFSSENRASTFRRLRSATANSGVLATSSAFCLAASQVWIAIVRNLPRVHCGFCPHPRQRLTVAEYRSARVRLLVLTSFGGL